MLTLADLQAFMHQHAVAGEILILDTPTPTVEAAAAAVGTRVENIVKSVLFTIDERRVLAVTCGTEPIERQSIAALYGIGRKRVKLAPPETVLQACGYPVGTVPPFGHPAPLETLIDRRVLEQAQVYAGGGEHNALVRLDPAEILRISGGQVLDLHARTGRPSTGEQGSSVQYGNPT